MKVFKIFFYQILLLFTLLICTEIFMGYWFDNHNFGPQMRGKRMQKQRIVFNDKETVYFRDYYGFRENDNIYRPYDASKIKIVFNGGSTTDETKLDYRDTIVGIINDKLKSDKYDKKIFNAGLNGKSLLGHINEFREWFDNIKNFKPDIIIYYIGINDTFDDIKAFSDFNLELNLINKLIFEVTQKSYFYEKLIFIKNKFFRTEINYYEDLKKNKNENFISFNQMKEEALKINVDKNIISKVDLYIKKLRILKKELDLRSIQPIFITQINYEGNSNKTLFFINEATKNFATENNYKVIKLDEMINFPVHDFFVDRHHTNKNGSRKIANLIYSDIYKFINNHYK